MTIYRATFDVYYPNKIRETGIPCKVRIDGNTIVISYEDDKGPVVYTGEETGEGHFKLQADGRNCRASLHRFADDPEVFEGWWQEDRYEGMWRLTLE